MGCYVQCHCPGWSSALCSFALDSIVDVKTRRQPCAPIVLYRATGLPKGRVVFKRLAGHHFCNRHFCLEGTFPVAVDTKRNLVRMKFFIPFVFLLGELSRPVNELSGHCERLRGQSYSIIASFRYKKKKRDQAIRPCTIFCCGIQPARQHGEMYIQPFPAECAGFFQAHSFRPSRSQSRCYMSCCMRAHIRAGKECKLKFIDASSYTSLV